MVVFRNTNIRNRYGDIGMIPKKFIDIEKKAFLSQIDGGKKIMFQKDLSFLQNISPAYSDTN